MVSFPSGSTEHARANRNSAGLNGWKAVGVIPKELNESWVLLKRKVIPESAHNARRLREPIVA